MNAKEIEKFRFLELVESKGDKLKFGGINKCAKLVQNKNDIV